MNHTLGTTEVIESELINKRGEACPAIGSDLGSPLKKDSCILVQYIRQLGAHNASH